MAPTARPRWPGSASGLSDLALLGIPTTQAFLRDAVRQPLFADGKADHALHRERRSPMDGSPMRTICSACAPLAVWCGRSLTPQPPRQAGSVRGNAEARPASRRRCGWPRSCCASTTNMARADAELSASREGIVIEIDGVVVDFEPPKAYGGVITLLAPGSSAPFVARGTIRP